MTGSPQSVGLGSDPRPGVSKEETRAGHTATHIRAGRPGSLTRVFRSVFPEARFLCILPKPCSYSRAVGRRSQRKNHQKR